MRAELDLYPASSSANVLFNRLKEVSTPNNKIGPHYFHGIINSNGTSKPKHVYCYCITFLQMLLHCDDIFEYFSNKKITNKNEILIHNIVDELLDKNNKKCIQIYDFIANWKGWEGKKTLPNKMSDIRNFIQFLFDSLSNRIQDLFEIIMETEENLFQKKIFYLMIPSIADSVQKNIELKLSNCGKIFKFPKYLLLYIDREENGNGFSNNYVSINSFISIYNVNYKFKSSALFTGSYNSGHYTAVIKICDKFFYFNDTDVYSVFFSQKSTAKTPNIIYDVNNGLNRNSVLYLYENVVDGVDLNSIENIDKTIYSNKEIFSKIARIFQIINQNPNININNNSNSNINTNGSSDDSVSDGNERSKSSNTSTESDSIQYFMSKSDISDVSDDDFNIYNLHSNSTPRPNLNNQLTSENLIPLDHAESTPVSPSNILIDDSQLITHHSQNIFNDLHFSHSLVDEILGHNICISDHSFIEKEKVDVETLNATNLLGVLTINNKDIPSVTNKRTEKGKYQHFRKLFHYVGSILVGLEYNDMGLINGEILRTKLNIQILEKDIVEQGNLLYSILSQIIDEGEFDFKKVRNRLYPIVLWYRNKYSDALQQDFLYNEKIDNELSDTLDKEDMNFQQNNIFFKKHSFPLSTVEDDLEYNEEENTEEIIKENMNFNESEYEDTEEEEEEEFQCENEEEENENKREDKKDHQENHEYIRKHHRLGGYLNWIPEEELDSSDIQTEIFDNEINNLNDDDNQFFLGEYNWKQRAEFIDVSELRKQIMNKITTDPENRQYGKRELRTRIIQEFLKEYSKNGHNFKSKKGFIKDYINRNTNDESEKSSNVKKYEKIIEAEKKRQEKKTPRKKRKNDEDKIQREIRTKKTSFIYGLSTLEGKINWFESCDKDERAEIMNSDDLFDKWGGSRDDVKKISDDTLDCLLSLVLDFPTMSASNYMKYLNSKYGPNFQNKISLRTVYTCLEMLNLTVKKASFAPPNRNSVGLRIFRVAWVKFMVKILEEPNILLGFIDEAAVTINQGRSFGRAYAGLTPVLNCPLRKIKMSVLAVVFPGFGVLYKFVNNSVDGIEYSRFLSDTNEFIRKYLCNNQTEIVIIEDNCPIHKSKCVESQLEHLDISLFPTVQYSPALNGVVEDYFGFVKLQNVLTSGEKGELAQRKHIEENWKTITNNLLTLEKLHNYYREWVTRMNECINGKPLFSGHIDVNSEIDVSNLTQVTVNRLVQNQ